MPADLGGGGATGAESRDCYLNMYAERKPDKVDPNEQHLSKWLNCAVSGEPLAPPCVIDRLGNAFNKEALVEALITRRLPRGFGHIKGLKDMIDVCLEPVSDKGGRSGVRFQCPVIVHSVCRGLFLLQKKLSVGDISNIDKINTYRKRNKHVVRLNQPPDFPLGRYAQLGYFVF